MSASGYAAILAAPTPDAWLQAAAADWPLLLIDHANCEKKAASTALALLFAYPEDEAACHALSRLAREELRHFEQVSKLMRQQGVAFRRLAPSRYAAGLRKLMASAEPQRKCDLLLVGALIEARSCERFERLAPLLPAPLSGFYADLARSEARHHELYLRLAAQCDAAGWRARLAELAAGEAELIVTADTELRFHSGVPQRAALASPAGS
ncbi:MAG: tRNA-(ms[2]io[6]A)-hydroxylase [Steroidobacteraceae bacterium]